MPVTLEAAEKLPISRGAPRVPGQLAAQVGQVDVAVGVLADDHDVGDGLAPRQLVGVVFVRADEDDRPFPGGDLVE
jgi:hypothetical protein